MKKVFDSKQSVWGSFKPHRVYTNKHRAMMTKNSWKKSEALGNDFFGPARVQKIDDSMKIKTRIGGHHQVLHLLIPIFNMPFLFAFHTPFLAQFFSIFEVVNGFPAPLSIKWNPDWHKWGSILPRRIRRSVPYKAKRFPLRLATEEKRIFLPRYLERSELVFQVWLEIATDLFYCYLGMKTRRDHINKFFEQPGV